MYDQATLDRLLFRRQFILGPGRIDRFPSWHTIDLGKALTLAVHPDLDVWRATPQGKPDGVAGWSKSRVLRLMLD